MLCPWDQFPPATLEFCERLLNGWVRQPANTWSNIGFVIVGLLIWSKSPANKPWLRIFAVGSFLIGLTSAVFHLSMTFAAQFFDVASMFMTAGMLVVLNMMRLKLVSPTHIYRALIIMQATAMLLMFIFKGGVGETIFGFQVAFIVFSEIALIRRDQVTIRAYRWWIASAASFGSATLVWIMDIRKFWCDPDNHWFNGHATWHLLNALVVWCLYRFYEEIVHID